MEPAPAGEDRIAATAAVWFGPAGLSALARERACAHPGKTGALMGGGLPCRLS